MKILVVEDDGIIGADLVLVLEEAGYEAVGPKGTIDQALEAIAEFEPDLVLLDLELLNGEYSAPVAEQLKAIGTPFICMTGHASRDYKDQAIFADVQRIEKPADRILILEAVEAEARTIGS